MDNKTKINILERNFPFLRSLFIRSQSVTLTDPSAETLIEVWRKGGGKKRGRMNLPLTI